MRKKEKNRWRLRPQSEEWDYVVEKLEEFWSPEQIVNRWRMERPQARKFGVCTLYRYIIKAGKFDGISKKTHLRRHGKKKWAKTGNYNTIHPDRLIPEWPADITTPQARGRLIFTSAKMA